MNLPAYRNELPHLWDDLALRPYLSEVSRRHGFVDALALPNMRDLPPIRIERLYVHPRLSADAVSPTSAPETWPEGESLFAALQAAPCLVLLGDPGSGKTTLTNWLAWRLSSGLVTSLPGVLDARVPIPCVLREMPASAFSSEVTVADLAVLVARHLLGTKADESLQSSLRARVQAKQYVLILDGIDEIKVAHREVVAAWIKQAAQDKACVVATARIVGYEDYPVHRPFVPSPANAPESALASGHLHQMRGPSRTDDAPEKQAQAWAQIRFLMPFDQKRVASFIENWYLQRSGSDHEAGQKAKEFLDALTQSEFLNELARTPNLLSLMAIVYRERAYLPDGKALLYKEIANAYINTIDRQRKLDDSALAPYTWEVREGWLAFVGFQMQLERENTDDALPDSGLLVSEGQVLDWLAQAMAASQVDDAHGRARDFLGWIARRSGLLLPRGAGRYAFVHLSFQEYFCARYLAGRIMSPAFIRNKQSGDAPVTRKKLREWSESPLWRESLVYLLELISGERDADWVEDLVEILFDANTPVGTLSNGQAQLCARVLTDRHIHMTRQRKASLAKRCVPTAMYEWTFVHVTQSRPVLAALAHVHHAALVITDGSPVSELLHELPTLKPRTLTDSDGDADLYILIAPGLEIDSAAQIARDPNLQMLDLRQSRVSDIAAVANLKALEYLNLSGTHAKNFGPLAGLRRLRQLELTATMIEDISPLSNLVSLKILDLQNTRVRDIAPLACLKKLEVLDLSDSLVADISPLKHLTNLYFLALGRTTVTDIADLKDLRSLEYLDLSNTRVTDLSALREMRSLNFLHIPDTPELDVSVLEHLEQLQIIRA